MDIHALEPSSFTFSQLSSRFAGRHLQMHRLAMGDEVGCVTLGHLVAPGAGTNLSTMHMDSRSMWGETQEVTTTTMECLFYLGRLGSHRFGQDRCRRT